MTHMQLLDQLFVRVPGSYKRRMAAIARERTLKTADIAREAIREYLFRWDARDKARQAKEEDVPA